MKIQNVKDANCAEIPSSSLEINVNDVHISSRELLFRYLASVLCILLERKTNPFEPRKCNHFDEFPEIFKKAIITQAHLYNLIIARRRNTCLNEFNAKYEQGANKQGWL